MHGDERLMRIAVHRSLAPRGDARLAAAGGETSLTTPAPQLRFVVLFNRSPFALTEHTHVSMEHKAGTVGWEVRALFHMSSRGSARVHFMWREAR